MDNDDVVLDSIEIKADQAYEDFKLRWHSKLDKWELAFTNILEEFLRRQEAVVIQRLKGPKSRKGTRHWSPQGERKISEDSIMDAATWINEASNDTFGLMVRLFDESGTDAIETAFDQALANPTHAEVESPWADVEDPGTPKRTTVNGEPHTRKAKPRRPPFDGQDSRVTDAIRTRTGRIGGSTEIISRRIRDSIATGEAAGESIAEIAQRVHDVYDKHGTAWAESVARTEVAGGVNEANMIGASQSGVVDTKAWLTVGDSNVRPWHEQVAGKVVLLEDDFYVGGDYLQYPGDSRGSPANIQNCRCTLLYGLFDELPEALSAELSGWKDRRGPKAAADQLSDLWGMDVDLRSTRRRYSVGTHPFDIDVAGDLIPSDLGPVSETIAADARRLDRELATRRRDEYGRIMTRAQIKAAIEAENLAAGADPFEEFIGSDYQELVEEFQAVPTAGANAVGQGMDRVLQLFPELATNIKGVEAVGEFVGDHLGYYDAQWSQWNPVRMRIELNSKYWGAGGFEKFSALAKEMETGVYLPGTGGASGHIARTTAEALVSRITSYPALLLDYQDSIRNVLREFRIDPIKLWRDGIIGQTRLLADLMGNVPVSSMNNLVTEAVTQVAMLGEQASPLARSIVAELQNISERAITR